MVEGIPDRGSKFSTLAAGQSSQPPNRTRYPNAKVGEAAVVNFGPRVALLMMQWSPQYRDEVRILGCRRRFPKHVNAPRLSFHFSRGG